MLPGHLVQDLHEGGDESVDVALVVQARRLQDHQSAKQLGRGTIAVSETTRQSLCSKQLIQQHYKTQDILQSNKHYIFKTTNITTTLKTINTTIFKTNKTSSNQHDNLQNIHDIFKST